jgi:D-alanyl-D-alanine carboxypeptidase (penicillin-binding protein 5/6)
LKLLEPEYSSAKLVAQNSSSRVLWPSVGQSAVGILGSTIVATHGPQVQTPTASVAKLITSLVVLKTKPLQTGQQGPVITLSPSDVAIYNAYVAEQGSVVPVVAGETISEYQMLEAMLLPSANNMADSLAIWAYGSMPAYIQAANTYLAQHGLKETHVGSDASGYIPATTSTAHDLVLLGELTLQNTVLAQIVDQPSAVGVPHTSIVKNVNFLLGNDGIIGIKTGNTIQAGGVFVSGSQTLVNHKIITVVTALASAPTLFSALYDSQPLVQSSHSNFQPVTLVKAGTIVGRYDLPWGGSVPVIASKNFTVVAWGGSPLPVTIKLLPISAKSIIGKTIGTVSVEQSPYLNLQNLELKLNKVIPQPDIWWRLKHPVI